MKKPTIPARLARRAVQIADECMRSDVECHGVPLDGLHSGRYGLTNSAQHEVRELTDASAELQIAFQWLRDRGLAELRTDGGGQSIQLHLERFAS